VTVVPLRGPSRFLVGETLLIDVHESDCPVCKPGHDVKWFEMRARIKMAYRRIRARGIDSRDSMVFCSRSSSSEERGNWR
jgi:hypothetical protein